MRSDYFTCWDRWKMRQAWEAGDVGFDIFSFIIPARLDGEWV